MHMFSTCSAVLAASPASASARSVWNPPGRQHAGSVGREADQIGAARAVDREERSEHGSDQYGAAVVGLSPPL